MLHAVADALTEYVKNDLTYHEEEYSKRDIAKWPPVLKCICDKDDLHDDVDEQADAVEKIQDHKEAHSILGSKCGLVLEGQNRHCARGQKHANRTPSNEPDRLPCAVLI